MTRHGHTRESLTAFRDRVAEAFKAKRILAPVHFPGGEEEQLIAAMADIRPDDWLCVGWRSMYAALLKGCPEEWVFDEILAGRSMYLMSKEHRIIGSSIVGGVLPVACGLAMGIRRGRDTQRDELIRASVPSRVWVVVGDMTATTGLFAEFVRYCAGHGLPVRVVVCDNGYSTNAPTEQVWGTSSVQGTGLQVTRFRYKRTMPHVGLAERVSF
jgi:TPP-dependent pyruvate/acetoin dehydrogenase alpha subunit